MEQQRLLIDSWYENLKMILKERENPAIGVVVAHIYPSVTGQY